jgi:hypothetical protein
MYCLTRGVVGPVQRSQHLSEMQRKTGFLCQPATWVVEVFMPVRVSRGHLSPVIP